MNRRAEDGDGAPDDEDHDHDGGDDHDLQRLLARFMHTLDVFPPEIHHDQNGEAGGKVVFGKNQGVVDVLADIFDEASEVLASRNGTDGASENVVEQQRRNRKFGQGTAHGLLDHAVHSSANKHAAGFDIQSAHTVTEQHDRENEPRGALADDLLGVTASVIRRRSKVGKDDGRRPPERDEGQHHRGGNEHLYRGTPYVGDG